MRRWTASLSALGRQQERCVPRGSYWLGISGCIVAPWTRWHWVHSTSIPMTKMKKESKSKIAKLNPSDYCSSDSVSNLNLPNIQFWSKVSSDCSGHWQVNVGAGENTLLQIARDNPFSFTVRHEHTGSLAVSGALETTAVLAAEHHWGCQPGSPRLSINA